MAEDPSPRTTLTSLIPAVASEELRPGTGATVGEFGAEALAWKGIGPIDAPGRE
jgi:hypothetical protein